MSVRPVQTYDCKSSNLSNVVAATTTGALAGYATKWLYPVTKQEKAATAYKEALALIKEKGAKFKLNLLTKKIRPASWFIAAGAFAGFALGVAHNVLKTEVKPKRCNA